MSHVSEQTPEQLARARLWDLLELEVGCDCPHEFEDVSAENSQDQDESPEQNTSEQVELSTSEPKTMNIATTPSSTPPPPQRDAPILNVQDEGYESVQQDDDDGSDENSDSDMKGGSDESESSYPHTCSNDFPDKFVSGDKLEENLWQPVAVRVSTKIRRDQLNGFAIPDRIIGEMVKAKTFSYFNVMIPNAVKLYNRRMRTEGCGCNPIFLWIAEERAKQQVAPLVRKSKYRFTRTQIQKEVLRWKERCWPNVLFVSDRQRKFELRRRDRFARIEMQSSSPLAASEPEKHFVPYTAHLRRSPSPEIQLNLEKTALPDHSESHSDSEFERRSYALLIQQMKLKVLKDIGDELCGIKTRFYFNASPPLPKARMRLWDGKGGEMNPFLEEASSDHTSTDSDSEKRSHAEMAQSSEQPNVKRLRLSDGLLKRGIHRSPENRT